MMTPGRTRWMIRIAAAVVVALGLWAGYRSLGGNAPAIGRPLTAWTQSVSEGIEAWMGEHAMLQQRAQAHIRSLLDDMSRLMWVEAEATAYDALLDERLQALRENQETARAALRTLADGLERGEGVTLRSGERLDSSQVEALAERKRAEFITLEQFIALLAQAQRTYRETAAQARREWLGVQNDIQTLYGYLTLLAATEANEEATATTPNTGAGPRLSSDELTAQIEQHIERTRRIRAERQNLQPPAMDETLLQRTLDRSTDLIGDLRTLADDR